MKTTLFILCLLSATAALAQNGGSSRSSDAYAYQFSSHQGHATYAPMAQGQSVLPGQTYSSAQGDRRPSDFAQPDQVSLGAVARELKRQHAELRKSRVVWVNQ